MINQAVVDSFMEFLSKATHIVVIQADNPDADSLGSALALEELLENTHKKITMYCGVDVPGYLRYISGWDRVTNELPKNFDASIIVDASTVTLLQKLSDSADLSRVANKPCAVIDHHETVINPIEFAQLSIIEPSFASTGDIIAQLCQQGGIKITSAAAEVLLVSILGDTQGLSNSLASADTYRTVAMLIDAGADRPALEERRRTQSKMPTQILHYKAKLIQKTQFSENGRIAYVTINQQEINEYSPLYNPAPLIQGDLLQTEHVSVALVFKTYDSGRLTGSLRCNNDAPVAGLLAESFGGGGHKFAAGFKRENVNDFDSTKKQVIDKLNKLLEEYGSNATV